LLQLDSSGSTGKGFLARFEMSLIGGSWDPTTQENRLLTQGRGIYLMKALVDEVRFEEGGAVVYMRNAPNATEKTAGSNFLWLRYDTARMCMQYAR
jgi:hypothetical protein